MEKTKTCDDDLEQLDWPYKDLESNIYNFGILLLEIISGKLPYSEEQGFLVNWVYFIAFVLLWFTSPAFLPCMALMRSMSIILL